MDVYKIRVTFNSLVDDGNQDVIFKELVVTDTLRYNCQAVSCRGCAPFDPACSPELVDVEAENRHPRAWFGKWEGLIYRTARGEIVGLTTSLQAVVSGLRGA